MISILVAAVSSFIFGFVWYTVIWGRTWERLMNFTPEAMEKAKQGGMAGKMMLMFLLNLTLASIMYFLFPILLPLSYSQFLLLSLVIFLGFSFPIYMNAYLWESKSLSLVLLNTVYGVLNMAIISAVIYFISGSL